MADNPVWDEEELVLRVMESKCRTCIFGPNSIVSKESLRAMIEETKQDDFGHVICHKTVRTVIGEGPGAICRGHWDNFSRHTFWGRLAVIEKIVKWWNPERDHPESVDRPAFISLSERQIEKP